MRVGRLISTAVAAGFATLAFASSALANTTITINPGNIPTTATGFGTHMCDPSMGGGPFPTQDVWVFVLPDRNVNGDFVSLDATFSTGTVHIDTTSNPGNFIIGGPQTSKAWVLAPAGATLTAATAVITGNVEPTTHFELTHTCPASGTPSPSPSMSKSATPTPSMSMSTMGTTPASTPATTASGAKPSCCAETGGGGSYGVTGLGVGALLLACSGGLALIWLRHRNQSV